MVTSSIMGIGAATSVSELNYKPLRLFLTPANEGFYFFLILLNYTR